MRIIVIGATGTIGSAVADLLSERHEVVRVGNSKGEFRVDLGSKASIEAMYHDVGPFDAVVCAAGNAAWGPLLDLDDAKFEIGLRSKLMGQVNVVRIGAGRVREGGSFTLTSGVLSREPTPQSSVVSLVNSAIEGFAGAAALDLGRGLRVNVVSPPWVSETLAAMGQDPSHGMPAAKVALAYREAVESARNGEVLDARKAGKG